MKIKEQTRKLAAGCSKHCFEVVDKTDEVSNHIYGKATLTWFEFDFRRVLYSRLNIDQNIAVAKTFLEIHLSFLIDLAPSYFNLL